MKFWAERFDSFLRNSNLLLIYQLRPTAKRMSREIKLLFQMSYC